MKLLRWSLLLVILLVVPGVGAQTQAENGSIENPAAAAKKLGSPDPVERQRAAEELASAVATDQRRLLEGYRLQEKNQRVKLALDWALYRVGKAEALFAVVRSLDSPRSEQAQGYLSKLESAEPLYLFIERANGNMQVKLLEVLARVGDSETLERLKPYVDSFDPKIADAARQAAREIEGRLGQPAGDNTTRPRRVVDGEASP